jgi:pentatricopeptide repeat protein
METKDNLPPDTFTYSTAISVCVEGKQWLLALELLEKMEHKNIHRNIITYNTVIEALEASGESYRAVIVYQMALKAGIYNHWQIGNEGSLMDLHNFPLSVAKNAVMHVLGEMSANRLTISDITIITGRGKHVNKNSVRGILRSEIENYLKFIGFIIETTNTANPGRIYLSKESINLWLESQKNTKLSDSVHQNLFIQVSKAKERPDTNVRAVCPFSSATLPTSNNSSIVNKP